MFKFMRKMSPNFTREKSFCIKRMAPGWFLLTVLYPALASAQVSELWVARYHGSVDGSNDAAVAMALDKAGNVYITGQSSGAITRRWRTIPRATSFGWLATTGLQTEMTLPAASPWTPRQAMCT
ncbi:MAG: hypothetical protein DMG45_23300 [Acidobacteria bacterium]|nr:MAG: hypothetical protein DMG45_23300 [Acidobacteriota bacterium]